MIIRCWGSRGSIPVSGLNYLKYGGDTTCMEIRTQNDEIIIIDAGSGIRRLGNRLIQENRKRCSLLFTHTHWDHILGFPFFKPIYKKGMEINISGCSFVEDSIKKMLSKAMSPPNFPVDFDDVNAQFHFQPACKSDFFIDSVSVSSIFLSHPNQGLGYKFTESGRSFVFLTDNELAHRHHGGLDFEDYLEFSTGADLLIHDAEYTEKEYPATKTWGHSLYKDALKLAMTAGVKKFGLFHHNQERFDNEVDAMVEDCRRIIKENNSDMECFAVSQEMEITI